MLSAGGRLILIKHVLSAIPLHVLAAMEPPKEIVEAAKASMGQDLSPHGAEPLFPYRLAQWLRHLIVDRALFLSSCLK